MRAHGRPGIIGLELAGSPARVDAIVGAWGAVGVAAARRSLIIDYGVLASYSPLMSTGCAAASRRFGAHGKHRLARLGTLLACGQVAAGACDAVESTALLAVLAGRRGILPATARASAQAKFLLLGLGVTYLAASGASALRW